MTTQAIEKQGSNPVAVIRNYLTVESVKQRLEETLGKRAGAFGNSIVNVVRNSKQLQQCSPDSVMSAAMIAATMNLPIDPALGQAAIVPYKNTAQFQIMYKGVTQLCIRSGQYATIHCSEIYQDELKSHNPITGVVKFKDPDTYKMRYSDKNGQYVVGHYAYFKLTTGFEKSDYMTREQVMAHARKYSRAYQYDLSQKKGTSAWSTDPIAMGNKTVLLRLLKKYGVMSIEMQEALVADSDTFEQAQADASERIAAETGSKVVDTEFEPNGDTAPPRKTRKNKKATKKTAKKVAATEVPQFKYRCSACEAGFDEPRMTGPEENTASCPNCKSLQVALNPDGGTPEFMDTSGD